MPRDLEQVLHDTAVRPGGHPDPAELVARGRRRRRLRRTAVGLGTAVAAGAVVLVAIAPLTAPGPPAVLDEPSPRAPSVAPEPESEPESEPEPDPGPESEPEPRVAEDREITSALVEFARDPSASAHAEIPFADQVALGLADAVVRQVDASSLADPREWVIEQEVFRAYAGPFSALDLLAQDRPTETVVGEHPHCASPPVPPPGGFEDHRRVSVQPTDVGSCLEWWTVDLFVADDGTVEAVTMDLYEP